MGFFSSLFGTDSGSTTEQTQNQTTKSNQTQTQTGKTQQQATGKTSALDDESLALLQGVVKQLAGGATGGTQDADTIRSLVSQLAGPDNAGLVDKQITSAQNEAKRQYQLGEGAQIAGTQQAIGSKWNTFSQQLEQKGNIDLQTSLTAISDTARLEASKQKSANLGAAIAGTSAASSAESAPLQQFLAAIGALTGAQTTQETSATELSDMLATILGTQDTTASGQSHTSGEVTQGLFPSLQGWVQ